MKSNHVQLIGFVGLDPKITKTLTGKRAFIRVATHDLAGCGLCYYNTIWHNVIAWDNLAQFAENNFVKGSRILVSGSIYCRWYYLHNAKLSVTEIKADAFINLDR